MGFWCYSIPVRTSERACMRATLPEWYIVGVERILDVAPSMRRHVVCADDDTLMVCVCVYVHVSADKWRS
jgi:hypothetical protein